jgi:hypothetical protein
VVGRAFAQVNRTALVPTVNRVMVRPCSPTIFMIFTAVN